MSRTHWSLVSAPMVLLPGQDVSPVPHAAVVRWACFTSYHALSLSQGRRVGALGVRGLAARLRPAHTPVPPTPSPPAPPPTESPQSAEPLTTFVASDANIPCCNQYRGRQLPTPGGGPSSLGGSAPARSLPRFAGICHDRQKLGCELTHSPARLEPRGREKTIQGRHDVFAGSECETHEPCPHLSGCSPNTCGGSYPLIFGVSVSCLRVIGCGL